MRRTPAVPAVDGRDRGVTGEASAVVRAFAARGFAWGGDWSSLEDHQHFSVSGG
ncbi:M15 family metallopeptidase [Paenibacillus sp. TRM 82003]|uniref:M15 family metallopeptidase n=1 Tax=Kineococcus sp. TRM81007 TaxID=2925831 RepID=UPI001F5700A4|nr:M15 family metallopeptidase [Kineococcus sp. TRM81007]MCI2240623.1 M15 family metallopeptidase [Kineococcus sp. TRM81007]MCI3925455.1 M15 family metallopeptidase [Paenibacillus sp. TRM 82003]